MLTLGVYYTIIIHILLYIIIHIIYYILYYYIIILYIIIYYTILFFSSSVLPSFSPILISPFLASSSPLLLFFPSYSSNHSPPNLSSVLFSSSPHSLPSSVPPFPFLLLSIHPLQSSPHSFPFSSSSLPPLIPLPFLPSRSLFPSFSFPEYLSALTYTYLYSGGFGISDPAQTNGVDG